MTTETTEPTVYATAFIGTVAASLLKDDDGYRWYEDGPTGPGDTATDWDGDTIDAAILIAVNNHRGFQLNWRTPTPQDKLVATGNLAKKLADNAEYRHQLRIAEVT